MGSLGHILKNFQSSFGDSCGSVSIHVLLKHFTQHSNFMTAETRKVPGSYSTSMNL